MDFIDALKKKKKKDSTESNAILEYLPIVCEDEFSPSTHTHSSPKTCQMSSNIVYIVSGP